MKKRVSVQLDGRSYVVITEDDEEYVKGIAAEVSENLLKASRSAKNLDVRDCAILVALDYCDDSKKEKRRNKELVVKADQIMQHTNELNRGLQGQTDRRDQREHAAEQAYPRPRGTAPRSQQGQRATAQV